MTVPSRAEAKAVYRKEAKRLRALNAKNAATHEECPSCELVGWDREGGYCRRCKEVIPSAEAIAAGAAEIREGWDAETYAKRSGTPYYKDEYRGELFLNPIDVGSHIRYYGEISPNRKAKGSDSK